MFSSFANTSRLVGTVFARSVTSGAAAAASASSRNFLACVPSNCTGGNDQLWSPSSRAWNIKYFAERTLSSSAAVRAKQPSRIGAAGGSVMVAGRRTGKQLAQKGLTAMPEVDLEAMPRINLNMLTNVPGATKQKIRVGRGRGSKKGKTSGRGHKGGQTPIWRLLPKRGKPAGVRYQYVALNLDTLTEAIESGKLDPKYPINMRHLWKCGAISMSYKKLARDNWGVKLLSRGAETFDIPVQIEVAKASRAAIAAIESVGGQITCRYYNKLGLKALLHPEKFSAIPRVPLPIPRVREWYEHPENRGVLATDPTLRSVQQAADYDAAHRA
eukprot:gene582-30141_t